MQNRIRTLWPVLAVGGIVALVLAARGSLLTAVAAGALAVVGAVLTAWTASRSGGDQGPRSPDRRRFLRNLGLAGLGLVAAGASVGRTVGRLLRPDPMPSIRAMARDLGSEILLFMRRGHYPGRTGELQLALRPYTVSNYPQESVRLARRDPRTSHAAPWMYLQRIPIVVWGPGIVEAADSTDRVTLADLAPTTARLMGFDGFEAPDGAVLPGIGAPARPPKVIVTFVIDGGGFNALMRFPGSLPNVARLMREGANYRDAVIGSYPAVTASAHATIGTGAFPWTHGIVGHNMREGPDVVQPFGSPGEARTDRILVPTLAEAWAREAGGEAWSGVLAYQIWHLSMIGAPGAPRGRPPVATYFDEVGVAFAPQHPADYRLPDGMPSRERLTEYLVARHGEAMARQLEARGRAVCCGPPIIRYQGDMIEAAFEHEGVGAGDATDLVYINFKAPDYAGHVYNMLSIREGWALAAVDAEVGRVRRILEERFSPGDYVLIVTADHGQSPLPDESGGARVDPIQLKRLIEREFGPSVLSLVQDVKPSEVYLHKSAMLDAGVSADQIAASLADLRYRDTIGPYVRPEAIDRRRLEDRLFAAVLPSTFIGALSPAEIDSFGPGAFPGSEIGMPPAPDDWEGLPS